VTSAAGGAADRGETPEPLPALRRDLPEVEEAARLPQGFRVAGVRAGIKASGLPDLALVVLDGPPAPVAATFTTNRLPAAPVQVNRDHLRTSHSAGDGSAGWVSAMISTSGCANAATGPAGLADQRALMRALADATGARREHMLGMSTGLIGTRLPVERVETAIHETVAGGLAADDDHWAAVAEALRTTDSRPKSASVRIELPGPDRRPLPVTVSGVAKGVGMIHPSMATMLSFVLTDASTEPDDLRALLRPIVARTWDQISVDGDQSTNDTVLLVASGASGAAPVVAGEREAAILGAAIEAVARSLARQQASDGEGATKLIACAVSGAEDDSAARAVARAVVSSSLVKAAIHGADPNWGRIAAAAGNATLASEEVLVAGGMPEAEARERAGRAVRLDPARLRIDLCGVPVFAAAPLPFDAAALSAAMKAGEVPIRVDLGLGDGVGEGFGCDLTEAYVIENSAYST
jgi:glutamate N-acetyltransferase / amino-acid N-acetyltransferase